MIAYQTASNMPAPGGVVAALSNHDLNGMLAP